MNSSLNFSQVWGSLIPSKIAYFSSENVNKERFLRFDDPIGNLEKLANPFSIESFLTKEIYDLCPRNGYLSQGFSDRDIHKNTIQRRLMGTVSALGAAVFGMGPILYTLGTGFLCSLGTPGDGQKAVRTCYADLGNRFAETSWGVGVLFTALTVTAVWSLIRGEKIGGCYIDQHVLERTDRLQKVYQRTVTALVDQMEQAKTGAEGELEAVRKKAAAIERAIPFIQRTLKSTANLNQDEIKTLFIPLHWSIHQVLGVKS